MKTKTKIKIILQVASLLFCLGHIVLCIMILKNTEQILGVVFTVCILIDIIGIKNIWKYLGEAND